MPADLAVRMSPEMVSAGVTAAAQHRAKAAQAPSRRASVALILRLQEASRDAPTSQQGASRPPARP